MFSGSLNSNTDQLQQYVLAVIVQFFFPSINYSTILCNCVIPEIGIDGKSLIM